MSNEQINQLLERYDQALTTHDEEQLLRQLAAKGLLPTDWNQYFAALDIAAEAPEGLEQRLSDRIDVWQREEKVRQHSWMRHLMGMAATVAVLISVGYWAYGRQRADVLLNGDTFSDPQAAYDETEMVLTELSEHLNRGAVGMSAFEKMTQILNEQNK